MALNRSSVRLFIDETVPLFPPYSLCRWHTPHCRYRGLDVDSVISVLSFLRLTVVPVIHNSTNSNRSFVYGVDYDVNYLLSSFEYQAVLNLSLTNTIYEEHISVVTTDAPISADRDLFALFSPFSWQLWLAFTALWLVNRIFAKLGGKSPRTGALRVHFTHDFKANVVLCSLGLMLLVSLYRCGLLTGLLISRDRYLVETVHDIVRLPATVKIYSYDTYWHNLVQSALVREDRILHDQITQIEPIFKVIDETILNEIRGGRAIFVGLESTASHAIHSCRLGGLRQQLLPIQLSYGIAVNQTASPDLLPMLNLAINQLYDTFENLYHFYMRRAPRERICSNSGVQPPLAAGVGSFSLSQMSGQFGLLAVGMVVAVVVLVAEKLIVAR